MTTKLCHASFRLQDETQALKVNIPPMIEFGYFAKASKLRLQEAIKPSDEGPPYVLSKNNFYKKNSFIYIIFIQIKNYF